MAPPQRLSLRQVRTLRKNLLTWYQDHARDLPWRRDPTPYAVTVSEFMLQQTQVKTVLPYFRRWMKRFPDWKALAKAPEGTVIKAWEGLGYYSRARNLHRLAQTVVIEYGGSLPDDPTALRNLPGIGAYTSGAILSIAFGRRHPLVDGNVERVFARLFDWPEDIKSKPSQAQLWSWAEQLTPRERPGDFNQALMELGALVCSPKHPQCLICPLQRLCQTPEPESRPVRTRTRITRESVDYALIRRQGKVWLLKPGTPGRWKSLHRLPEFDPDSMSPGKKLATFSFGITRYQVNATLVAASFQGDPPPTGAWIPIPSLADISLPAPHRKALEGLKVES